MKYRIVIALLLITCIAGSQACTLRKKPLGTKDNPVKIWFMPLKDETVFKEHAPKIEAFLEGRTGFAVQTTLAPSFVDIIKAMGKKKADVAFMNTLGFLLAQDWAGANAQLQYIYGDVYRSYRGEIIARADSSINAPEDLTGKTFAFADPYSAGGYLYALKYLEDHKIKPKKTEYAGGHLRAVELVYRGEADAAATYHERPGASGEAKDARIELIKKYPDILTMVKIVALTDEIPNGPIATRKDLPQDVQEKIAEALKDFAETPEGRAALTALYNVTGLAPVDNAAYDGVRRLIKQLGKEIQDMVPGGDPYYRTAIEIGLE